MDKKYINITIVVVGLILTCSIALADSDRDMAVDMAIGGMKEGSHILPPGTYGRGIRGNNLSSGMDARSVAKAGSSETAGGIGSRNTGGNLGNFHGGASGPSETGPNQSNAPSGEVEGHIDSSLGAGHSGIEGTSEISAGAGDSLSGGGSESSAPGSSDGSTAIVEVDLQADLESGTVDAGLGIDTSNDTLLDADVGGATSSTTSTVEADIGSASEIIGEDTTAVTEPLDTSLSAESPLIGDVDATAESVAPEADVGIEADVSGVSAGDDVVSDPADGISSGL